LRALDEQQGDGVWHARHIVIIHHVHMFKSGSCGIFVIIMMFDESQPKERLLYGSLQWS
jgi:hypothetical protein